MVCLALATPVAKTCDAGGGALRSQRRQWPGSDYWANLVRAGTLANAAICNICITCELFVMSRVAAKREGSPGQPSRNATKSTRNSAYVLLRKSLKDRFDGLE